MLFTGREVRIGKNCARGLGQESSRSGLCDCYWDKTKDEKQSCPQ